MYAFSKTTYIPYYFTQIMVSGTETKKDSTNARDLTISPLDERYTITVMHDSVTQERVKSIKRSKSTSGWATASMFLSGMSASLNPIHTARDAVNYMNDIQNMYASGFLSVASMQDVEALQKVPISILIENNSEKEMTVNDLNRGLFWHIPSHSFLRLGLGNPEVNTFRLGYVDSNDERVDYINIQAGNYLEKKTIAYEDNVRWIFPVYENQEVENSVGKTIVERNLTKYIECNKRSMERKYLSKEEYNVIKKNK